MLHRSLIRLVPALAAQMVDGRSLVVRLRSEGPGGKPDRPRGFGPSENDESKVRERAAFPPACSVLPPRGGACCCLDWCLPVHTAQACVSSLCLTSITAARPCKHRVCAMRYRKLSSACVSPS